MTPLSAAATEQLRLSDQKFADGEKARLDRLERTVDRAVEVAGKIAGEALAVIRDEKLYRRTHTTFAAYVEARWGFTANTAYRMIRAAKAPELPPPVEPATKATDPAPSKPSRSATGRPDSPFVIPEPAPADPPPDDERLWGTVTELGDGLVTIQVEDGEGRPALDQRVLLAWTDSAGIGSSSGVMEERSVMEESVPERAR